MTSSDLEDQELGQEVSSFHDFQHLNIDLCLELIFPFLDVIDLSRAADTCEQMRSAANRAFSRKYGKYRFCIKPNTICEELTSYKCNSFNNRIWLRSPKLCLQVVRCFGHLICKLHLICNFDLSDMYLSHLDDYLIEYCANYLTDLAIAGRHRSFAKFQASFPNVENVQLLDCSLDRPITKFNERFPKLRRLELAPRFRECTTVTDHFCIVAHFQHLEHLSIAVHKIYLQYQCGFQEKSILSCLTLNPNIRSLNLVQSGMLSLRKEFLENVSELCMSAEKLQISGFPLRFDGRVHFKNVKYFKMNHYYDLTLPRFPLTFGALEVFDYESLKPSVRFIFDFIRSNPTLTKLNLSLQPEYLKIFQQNCTTSSL